MHHRCWCWCHWAARSGEGGNSGGGDKEFNDFHDVLSVVDYLLPDDSRIGDAQLLAVLNDESSAECA